MVMDSETLYALISKDSFFISTDSRNIQPGAIFIALKGTNFDANAFAETAITQGALYAIIDNPAYKKDERYIVVKNTLKTLQDLARIHRATFSTPILAIGGSNGKTTTKELIHAVLSKRYRTHTTTGNLNNNIGVPLTLLGMKKDAEIAAIEIGANHPSEHIELLDILSPTHVLITNNGADHLEGFGSLDGVRAANKEIYDWAREHTAHAFVNESISDLVEDSTGLDRTLYPTKSHESSSSLYAGVIYDGIEFTTTLFGAYNEPNILAAIAIGEYFDVPLHDIRTAIADYIPTLKRSQILQKDTYSVVLDCYNANPSSMELALRDFVGNSTSGKRIVIIGDMFEMGAVEENVHKDILDLTLSLVDTNDIVLCVGPRFGIYASSFPFHFYESSKEARSYFDSLDLTNKVVFLKASRGMKLEEVIKEKVLLI